MRNTAHCYFADILKASTFSEMNDILNDAIRDTIVPSSTKEEYNYPKICKAAQSRGFEFAKHFNLQHIGL